MPQITITEKDFRVLACAAANAQEAGDMDQALALDRLARMANAALTGANTSIQAARRVGIRSTIRWQDMPSTLTP